jgi:hypothetical protein
MKKRPIRIDGDIAFVPLTKGYEAIIDAEDVDLVKGHNWWSEVCFKADGSLRAVYARSDTSGMQYIHRVIMRADEFHLVDHIDGNGIDCRKSNMRLTANTGNSQNKKINCNNTSGFKGVTWNKRREKWEVKIMAYRKKKHIGYYVSLDDAAEAYSKASAIYHGEFGRIG